MAELLFLILVYFFGVRLAIAIFWLICDHGADFIAFLFKGLATLLYWLFRPLVLLLAWLGRCARATGLRLAAYAKDGALIAWYLTEDLVSGWIGSNAAPDEEWEDEDVEEEEEEQEGTGHDACAAARELLGVTASADATEVKQAYRRAIRSAHPDKGGSVEAAQAVNEAYELVAAQLAHR